ncbi:MAG: hypothetical protein GYB39_02780 [Algicola sp.]|nr:hypothetical protein [Algicola sp.]
MKTLYCKLFKHTFVIKKHVTNAVMEYQCIHCKTYFTTSDKGQIIPLTSKRQEINLALERLHKIRSKKRKLNALNH